MTAGAPVRGPRRGRVRAGDRSVRVATDVTPEQHRILKGRAEAEGLTLASWLYLRIDDMVKSIGEGSDGEER